MSVVSFFLLGVLVVDLWLLVTARLASAVRACALQGIALSLLPLLLARGGPENLHAWLHPLLIAVGSLSLKGFLIPALLWWAIRRITLQEFTEPVVSLHVSAVAGAIMIGAAFWLARLLPVSRPPSDLLVPVAFATLLIGFLILVSRRQAFMQVIGYLTLENGVFLFGQLVNGNIPLVVEFGILLDLLAAVAIMAIVIFHINHVFNHVDAGSLLSLRD